ncbi:MAG: hypothetical protein QM621_06765 [Aeromicrobium sp.]|uniref:hypothetical protein n=1 Tax=Aeromicrobium sp. TaxID=1871063 RepID=UPI0039E27D3E
MAKRFTMTVTAAMTATLLAGCGGESAFCAAVNADAEASASAFTPLVPGQDGTPQPIDDRLIFMDEVKTPPKDLADEWDVFYEYLSGYDPVTWQPEPPEVLEARQALFEASQECRE